MSTQMPGPMTGRAPCSDDDVLKALERLSYERALEACKLLVEKWLGELSYFRSGPKKQKWELLPEQRASSMPNGPTSKVADPVWRLTLATERHHYYIRFSPTYMGCVASARVVDAGESHTRGNDLPDGPFGRVTWSHILTEMLAYELVEIPKEQPGVPVPTDLWTFVDAATGRDKADWAVEMEKRRAHPLLGQPGEHDIAAVAAESPA